MKNYAIFQNLPEGVKEQWSIYCGHYSEEYTVLFLKELYKVKDSWTKYQLWDKVTRYTTHGDVAGESEKTYFKNYPDAEKYNQRLDYLYDAWDRDAKHTAESRINQELKHKLMPLKDSGNYRMFDVIMAENKWRRERVLHGGDWPVGKILDYMKLD